MNFIDLFTTDLLEGDPSAAERFQQAALGYLRAELPYILESHAQPPTSAEDFAARALEHFNNFQVPNSPQAVKITVPGVGDDYPELDGPRAQAFCEVARQFYTQQAQSV